MSSLFLLKFLCNVKFINILLHCDQILANDILFISDWWTANYIISQFVINLIENFYIKFEQLIICWLRILNLFTIIITNFCNSWKLIENNSFYIRINCSWIITFLLKILIISLKYRSTVCAPFWESSYLSF